jgi:hypothetical protein
VSVGAAWQLGFKPMRASSSAHGEIWGHNMRRPIAVALSAAVLGSAVLGFAASSSVAQQNSAKPPAGAATTTSPAGGTGDAANNRQVFLTIKDLMESIIDPSADTLWGAVGTVVDNEGIHEMFPKTQEEWQEPRRAAVRMIEGSNLLIMPGREAAPPGTKSEAPGAELEPPQITVLIKEKRQSFDAFARALQGLGVEALGAIDAKDTSLLLEIGARMENVCEGCHQTFWYPQEKDISTDVRNARPLQNR